LRWWRPQSGTWPHEEHNLAWPCNETRQFVQNMAKKSFSGVVGISYFLSDLTLQQTRGDVPRRSYFYPPALFRPRISADMVVSEIDLGSRPTFQLRHVCLCCSNYHDNYWTLAPPPARENDRGSRVHMQTRRNRNLSRVARRHDHLEAGRHLYVDGPISSRI
jgi:hypothetical protein